VLDELRDQIAAKDREIERLRAELHASAQHGESGP
jgi:uncharacterized small protein (DUF1192 family)